MSIEISVRVLEDRDIEVQLETRERVALEVVLVVHEVEHREDELHRLPVDLVLCTICLRKIIVVCCRPTISLEVRHDKALNHWLVVF